jgi:hypothetical protein
LKLSFTRLPRGGHWTSGAVWRTRFQVRLGRGVPSSRPTISKALGIAVMPSSQPGWR